MANKVETIWDYLESLGISHTPRPDKKMVPYVLESEKMSKAQLKRLALTGMFSEKLDGVFSFITVIPRPEDTLEIRHWNRTGKAMPNCGLLDLDLMVAIKGNVSRPLVLISEVTSANPLAKLSGYVNPNRVNGSDFVPTKMEDNIHDVIYLSEFINGKSTEPFHVRYDLVERLFEDTLINVIPMYHGDFTEAREYAKDIWARQGEGVVYADPMAGWTAGKRDETKVKIKEKLSFDVTVVGMVSGKEGSKYELTMGKLVVAFRAFGDPDGELLWIPISGMTDTQRHLWWNNPGAIVGSIVKMDAKSYTENGNLREPRFKEVRHDKAKSDFPVKVLDETKCFTKGKANHIIHELEVEHE